MQKFILSLLIILSSLSLLAQQEPVVKIYQSDGSTKQYNIKDIADMSFIHSNLSYSMIIFQKDNSKISYDIRLISSINFVENQKLQIKFGFEPTTFNISEIDSIIFTFNTCTEIQIGNQIWMCKNLDVDLYRNGDSIPEVRDSTEWVNLKTGAWCYYNNDPELGKIYGKLYNWYAVNDPRGLAPEGWHVATDAEYTALTDYLGGIDSAAGKMKETGRVHWLNSFSGVTNESGFSALPGGIRSSDGDFDFLRGISCFWTFTVKDSIQAWARWLYHNFPDIRSHYTSKRYGTSVRCISGNYANNPKIDSINPTIAKNDDIIIISGSGFGANKGTNIVSFNGAKATVYLSMSSTEIKVKVPIDATSGKLSVNVGGLKSNEVDFTLKYSDPNEVTICKQVWMRKNLDVDHYRNGDSIPEVRDSAEWVNLKTGAWCYYNNDPEMGKIYGKLYNWYAVNDERGLAPAGWHVAADSEWTELTNCLSGGDIQPGGKMKEIGTTHWLSPNRDATNESGFTALPGGNRYDDGIFGGVRENSCWWSSTEYHNKPTEYAYVLSISYAHDALNNGFYFKLCGKSVRCIKDK